MKELQNLMNSFHPPQYLQFQLYQMETDKPLRHEIEFRKG